MKENNCLTYCKFNTWSVVLISWNFYLI